MNKEHVQAIVFDMDGVIIDTEPLSNLVFDQMMAERGLSVSEEIHRDFVGNKTSRKWAFLQEMYGFAGDVKALTRESDQRYLDMLVRADLNPIEGLIDLVDSFLTRNFKITVASSSSRYNIRLVLDKFDLLNRFEGFVSGEDVKQTKPNPDIFLMAADRLDVSPENCLVIEDSKNGVTAARAAGMQVIGFQNPNSGNQDLSQAHLIVQQLRDILDWI